MRIVRRGLRCNASLGDACTPELWQPSRPFALLHDAADQLRPPADLPACRLWPPTHSTPLIRRPATMVGLAATPPLPGRVPRWPRRQDRRWLNAHDLSGGHGRPDGAAASTGDGRQGQVAVA